MEKLNTVLSAVSGNNGIESEYFPVISPEIECQCGLTLYHQRLTSCTAAMNYLNNDIIMFINHRLNSDCNRMHCLLLLEDRGKVCRKVIGKDPTFKLALHTWQVIEEVI